MACPPRDRELFFCDANGRDSRVKKRLFRRDAETSTRDACALRNEPNWTILHTSFLQLRESDLYGRGRIAQLSFFFLRRSFFARSEERRVGKECRSGLARGDGTSDSTI